AAPRAHRQEPGPHRPRGRERSHSPRARLSAGEDHIRSPAARGPLSCAAGGELLLVSRWANYAVFWAFTTEPPAVGCGSVATGAAVTSGAGGGATGGAGDSGLSLAGLGGRGRSQVSMGARSSRARSSDAGSWARTEAVTRTTKRRRAFMTAVRASRMPT